MQKANEARDCYKLALGEIFPFDIAQRCYKL